MNALLLVITADPECRSRIEAVAGEEMIECYFASHGDHLTELVKRLNPFLLIVDFSSEELDWIIKHVSEIKDRHHNFPIIGVISDEGESNETRMQKAGCDHVIRKTRFLKNIKTWIEKYFR